MVTAGAEEPKRPLEAVPVLVVVEAGAEVVTEAPNVVPNSPAGAAEEVDVDPNIPPVAVAVAAVVVTAGAALVPKRPPDAAVLAAGTAVLDGLAAVPNKPPVEGAPPNRPPAAVEVDVAG